MQNSLVIWNILEFGSFCDSKVVKGDAREFGKGFRIVQVIMVGRCWSYGWHFVHLRQRIFFVYFKVAARRPEVVQDVSLVGG